MDLATFTDPKFTHFLTQKLFLFIQVNDKFLFHQAGNFNEGPNIHQILAQDLWPNTFRLDRTTFGKPIGTVTREKSWKACLGRPMEQPVPGENCLCFQI